VLGVGTLNNYIAVLFYAGFIKVFLEFCKVFESGGIGKNGSTIAVSPQKMAFIIYNNTFLYLLPFYIQ